MMQSIHTGSKSALIATFFPVSMAFENTKELKLSMQIVNTTAAARHITHIHNPHSTCWQHANKIPTKMSLRKKSYLWIRDVDVDVCVCVYALKPANSLALPIPQFCFQD